MSKPKKDYVIHLPTASGGESELKTGLFAMLRVTIENLRSLFRPDSFDERKACLRPYLVNVQFYNNAYLRTLEFSSKFRLNKQVRLKYAFCNLAYRMQNKRCVYKGGFSHA